MDAVLPFLPLFFVWLFAAISPGPDFIITVRHALNSRKAGLFTAIGLGCGITVHVTYCLLGIALIISRSILLFNFLKLLAAAYLIFIGWKALSSKGQGITRIESTEKKEPLSSWKAFRIGFLTNVLNPKATIFFLGLFTVGITPEMSIFSQVIFGIVMALGTIVWFSLVTLFFSQEKIQGWFQRFAHIIDKIFGAFLIALGVKIVLSKN